MDTKPLPLDDIERAGATRFGFAVRCVWMELEDGRMVKAELPLKLIADNEPVLGGESHPELCDLAREILQVLTEAEGEWVQGIEVAKRINEDVDHTDGNWSRAVKELRDAGKIESTTRRGYRLKTGIS